MGGGADVVMLVVVSFFERLLGAFLNRYVNVSVGGARVCDRVRKRDGVFTTIR